MSDLLTIDMPRTASETLVAGEVTLKVADIVVKIIGSNLEPHINGAMREFIVANTTDDEPEVVIRTSWNDLNDTGYGRKLFDSGSLWQLYENADGYEIRLAGVRAGQSVYKRARFNRDFTRGEVICDPRELPPDIPIYPLEYPLDELLFMNLLARGRGVEIHSCGLIDRDGRGLLFAGHSEAGKTTTANLWRNEKGVRILSDDRIIVRKVDGQFYMYGTPWHGDARLALPERAPLSHIFILKHGARNELVPMSQARASAEMFARGFPPYHFPEGLDFTLGLMDELTRTVECDELRFVPDGSVVDFVREAAGRNSLAA